MHYFKSVIIGCLLLLATLNFSAWSDQGINTQLIRLETFDGINLTGVLRQHHSVPNGVGIVMVHGYSGNFYSGIMNFLPKMLADRLRNSAPPEAKVDVVKIAGAGHSLYNHQKDLKDTMSHWLMRQTNN
ncbi:MAG: hypothetical protein JSV38_01860 [Desulfobacterales bacterium]|nr:MAG: hypothetical protein JSV38_01860 [Desulfobacterales bacterium]